MYESGPLSAFSVGNERTKEAHAITEARCTRDIYLSVSCRFTTVRGLAFPEKCTNLLAGVFAPAIVHVHHDARRRFLVGSANNGATPCICLDLFISSASLVSYRRSFKLCEHVRKLRIGRDRTFD